MWSFPTVVMVSTLQEDYTVLEEAIGQRETDVFPVDPNPVKSH